MDHESASPSCTGCQRPTTKRCIGCQGAPLYNEGASKLTYYCSYECQKTDWCRHKSECRILQARKSLSRAASLLQAIICHIRIQACPLRLKSVRVEDSAIWLEMFEPNIMDFQKQLNSFPVCVGIDRSSFEAALLYAGCMEAMMYLNSFAGEFLLGICSDIKEVNATVKRKLSRSLVFQTDSEGTQALPHNVYRATLKNGEVWVIDTTGAWLGYATPLCSWRDLELQRDSKIDTVHDLGYTRYQIYKSYAEFPCRQSILQTIEKQELTELLDQRIPAWALEYRSELVTILKGSDTTFEQARERFLGQLDRHLKASMKKLHAPEKIERRNKETEQRLAQGMADSNKRKGLMDFERYMTSVLDGQPVKQTIA